ncbi:hypothetical protein DdX_16036 [Ditylenchus destructor]|uniref:Uncharacterized protein n=1 Tax=Ditylenchus destructor TaxID=166010 RepID=A0AAD4R0C0_9BILA|nr:hypothetical protein DdX_16036 [Ditylenchus destructor]
MCSYPKTAERCNHLDWDAIAHNCDAKHTILHGCAIHQKHGMALIENIDRSNSSEDGRRSRIAPIGLDSNSKEHRK